MTSKTSKKTQTIKTNINVKLFFKLFISGLGPGGSNGGNKNKLNDK